MVNFGGGGSTCISSWIFPCEKKNIIRGSFSGPGDVHTYIVKGLKKHENGGGGGVCKSDMYLCFRVLYTKIYIMLSCTQFG